MTEYSEFSPDMPFSDFQSGTNVVGLTTALRGTGGEELSEPLTFAFDPRVSQTTPHPVPNPVRHATVFARDPQEERPVRFVDLPPDAVITVTNPEGVSETLSSNAVTVDWYAPTDRTGLFPYEIAVGEEVVVRGAVVVVSEVLEDQP